MHRIRRASSKGGGGNSSGTFSVVAGIRAYVAENKCAAGPAVCGAWVAGWVVFASVLLWLALVLLYCTSVCVHAFGCMQK